MTSLHEATVALTVEPHTAVRNVVEQALFMKNDHAS